MAFSDFIYFIFKKWSSRQCRATKSHRVDFVWLPIFLHNYYTGIDLSHFLFHCIEISTFCNFNLFCGLFFSYTFHHFQQVPVVLVMLFQQQQNVNCYVICCGGEIKILCESPASFFSLPSFTHTTKTNQSKSDQNSRVKSERRGGRGITYFHVSNGEFLYLLIVLLFLVYLQCLVRSGARIHKILCGFLRTFHGCSMISNKIRAKSMYTFVLADLHCYQ
jgi:hypothetical protein